LSHFSRHIGHFGSDDFSTRTVTKLLQVNQAFLLFLLFFFFSFLKSAPVILVLGGATLASFFCLGEYLLKGITSPLSSLQLCEPV
jgi:fatty acid desaturase